MSIISELRDELKAYLTNHCEISISSVQWSDTPKGGGKGGPPKPPDGRLNPGEVFFFNVKIKNNGPLNMRNVFLLAEATPFAEPYYASIFDIAPKPFDIKANDSKTIEVKYRAKALAGSEQVVAKVAITGWSVDLSGPYAGTVMSVKHVIA